MGSGNAAGLGISGKLFFPLWLMAPFYSYLNIPRLSCVSCWGLLATAFLVTLRNMLYTRVSIQINEAKNTAFIVSKMESC